MKCVPVTEMCGPNTDGEMWECRGRDGCPFYYEWGRGEERNPGCHLTFNIPFYKEKKLEYQKNGRL